MACLASLEQLLRRRRLDQSHHLLAPRRRAGLMRGGVGVGVGVSVGVGVGVSVWA